MEATRWHFAPSGKKYCIECQRVAKQVKVEKDCEQCSNTIEIWEENFSYLRCFLMCCSQLRIGFSAAVGLDWTVVENVARGSDIPIDDTFYTNLQIFESIYIEEINAKPQ